MDATSDRKLDVEPVLAQARADIRALTPYAHATWDPALDRLHANELPWRALTDRSNAGLNRYPEPQPLVLLAALAKLYRVPVARILACRGSDEAIDLLVRAFCAAGQDAVLITPPTFGMYAVAARIQGAAVIEAPLEPQDEFRLDSHALLEKVTRSTRIIFLCSPNNPTGTLIPEPVIRQIAAATCPHALVVVDEAYGEFSAAASAARLIDELPNLVVLRTLSKAHGLAGVRLGSLIAHSGIVALLRRIIPPYALAQPTVEAALAALTDPQQTVTAQRITTLLHERENLRRTLPTLPCVLKVWPSEANFLLVAFHDSQSAFATLKSAGLMVRDVRQQPGLANALRITIGSPEQNARLLRALAG